MTERVRSRRRRIMREFTIKELSAVDRPAQAHARMTIMKRAIDKDDYGPAYPAELAGDVQALDFDDVVAEAESSEGAQRVKDEVWVRWHALCRSFETIAADDDVPPADKVTAMRGSLSQFVASLSEVGGELTKVVTDRITAVPALAGLLKEDDDINEGDASMTPAEKKQLDDLQKTVADLTRKLAVAAADDSAAKKAEDLQTALDAANAQVAELTETAAEATAKAGMSDAEKEYAAGLDAKGRTAFMAMTSEERRRKMKKVADDDPVVYKSESTGEEFRKSDDPRLVRMAKQADEDRQVAKDERARREDAEFSKRVDDELAHFAGDSADKVAVLRGISKMDDAARKTLEAMLKAGDKAVAAAFDKIGHSHETAKKSASDFNKRVDEIVARDRVGRSDAMKKARQEYPDEFKAYQGGAGN